MHFTFYYTERLRPSGSSSGDRKDTASPFSHSSHGNPAFTPQKVGKSSASVSKKVWSIHRDFFLPTINPNEFYNFS